MEIKSPWTMVWTEYIDDFIAFIKENLPPNHELQSHKLYPGIKYNREPIFIVDDDTTEKCLLINFNKESGKTRFKIPVIKVFENDDEVQKMIDQDHQKELDSYI